MTDLNGKICLITGASSGIGKESAIGIAQTGATVVIIGRNPSRTEEALAEIKQRSGNENIDMLLADLSSQKTIEQLAKQFQEKYSRLHILVNNAGGIFMQRQETADGYEMTFALNHLSYFLLTHYLLDLLKISAPARIVNVSSMAHNSSVLDFDDLNGTKKYKGMQAYGRSKLANILFTYELARQLEGSGVSVNCLHPGVVGSGFGQNNALFGFLVKLAKPFLMTPEQGAANTIYLATSPEVEGISGQYFIRNRAAKSSLVSYDKAIAQRLWAVSEQMVGVGGKSF